MDYFISLIALYILVVVVVTAAFLFSNKLIKLKLILIPVWFKK
jgi:hypothetical protein